MMLLSKFIVDVNDDDAVDNDVHVTDLATKYHKKKNYF